MWSTWWLAEDLKLASELYYPDLGLVLGFEGKDLRLHFTCDFQNNDFAPPLLKSQLITAFCNKLMEQKVWSAS